MSCSTKPCSLLPISVLQVPTGTISYQKFIDSEQKNIDSQLICLFKNFFSISVGTTLFGGGGGREEGMVDFFPFEVGSGKCPLGNCFSNNF